MSNFLLNSATRHQIFLQRYAGGRARNATKALNRLRRAVVSRLRAGPSEFRRDRLTYLLEDIDQLISNGFGDISNVLREEMHDLAVSEADFARKMVLKSLGVEFVLPSDAALTASVDGSIMGNLDVNIEDALRELTTKKRNQVANMITDGVTIGDSPEDIVTKVNTVMATLHRRQVQSLVRTAVNHVSSVARKELYVTNSRLIDGFEVVATLDGHTTLICGTRDGDIYPAEVGPYPPYHWGCRTTTTPAVKGRAPVGTRPSATGEVKGNVTYGSWLKEQPIEFIEEALGRERALLFRQGKLPLEKFVDPTGRVYTLRQLESMNPFVFQES